MRKNYYFRTDIAVKYGANAAILLHEFVRLTLANKAVGQNFCRDRYWVCASQRELSSMYPFLSGSQIERLIKKLRKNGILMVDNFNIDPMDRTNWYSPNDEILSIYEDYPWDKEE